MALHPYALEPERLLRSVEASRDTLGKSSMSLTDLVGRTRALMGSGPYAVTGGIAQILWARTTRADDVDLTFVATMRHRPKPQDATHEENDVFGVLHLRHRGAVVDFVTFKNAAFNAEILATARVVSGLLEMFVIRPELLLVTHLLRPGAQAALAALELVLDRRGFGDLDAVYARRWAQTMGKESALDRCFTRADEIASSSG